MCKSPNARVELREENSRKSFAFRSLPRFTGFVPWPRFGPERRNAIFLAKWLEMEREGRVKPD